MCKGAWRRGRGGEGGIFACVQGCMEKGEEKHQCERVHGEGGGETSV